MFLEIAFSDIKPGFSQENRSHYENCRLMPKISTEHDANKINEFK